MSWSCWPATIHENTRWKIRIYCLKIKWEDHQINPSRFNGLKKYSKNLIHSEKTFEEITLLEIYLQENWFHVAHLILNNSSIIQTSDRASTITRCFDLPLILVTKRVEVSRMHYFTNVSVPGSRIIVYRVSVRLVNHPCVYMCVCVCTLNKVEVWSCAIAARGSYVRPESLLGTRRGNVCWIIAGRRLHIIPGRTLFPGYRRSPPRLFSILVEIECDSNF